MNTLGRFLFLVALYVVTGKLGLLMAVPPGYATIIWPPSGIALGLLIVHGRSLWPGVLVGSFLLNVHVSDAVSAEHGVSGMKLLVALIIAIGSTLQATFGRALIARLVGLPVELSRARNVASLFLLAAPIACLVASTIGTGALILSGSLQIEQALRHWLTWWLGDMFGVLVFLPLVLIAPLGARQLDWRGRTLDALPFVAMVTLFAPLGLTFYAWKVASENAYRQSKAEFSTLAAENEKQLLTRIGSYRYALLGGAGFFEGSDFVSPQDWRLYVGSLELQKNFPGIQGMGRARPVDAQSQAAFEQEMRRQDPSFNIHPESNCNPKYVISYIEPQEGNRPALGLDLCFEKNRREAAELARDSGDTVVTRRITLVQDDTQSVGFLLLHPMYDAAKPARTVAERRDALRGWIYAPFVANRVLNALTESQGDTLDLSIYDGAESPERLIYSSGKTDDHHARAGFTVRKTLTIMQRQWLIVWSSTPTFSQLHDQEGPLLILTGGLMFTGLLALFLLVAAARRERTVEWLVEEQKFALPLTIFVIAATGAFVLYEALDRRESAAIRAALEEEAKKVDQLISFQTSEKLQALKRMAQRWQAAGGTPYEQWRADAGNYTSQLTGLRILEWVDASYRVRWAEPLEPNKSVIGLNVLFESSRAESLQGAERHRDITLTPPLDLVQGYKAFIAYAPIHVGDRFDGFIAGVFSIDEFFGVVLNREVSKDYVVTLSFADRAFFQTVGPVQSIRARHGSAERSFKVYDKIWNLRVAPTERLIDSKTTSLPLMVLAAGLLIAGLLAMTVRAILVAKLRAVRIVDANRLLSLSEEKHRMLVDGLADHAIIWLDVHGHISSWNAGARNLKGYTQEEVIGRHFALFFTEEDRAAGLPQQALAIAGRVGKYESEGWRVRKDGSRFWAHVLLEPIRDQAGVIVGFAKISHDETARRQYEQALRKSEQTFRFALERAPIGMALVDPSGRWLQVNPALCSLLGYSREEMLRTDFQTLTHPDDLAGDLERVREVLSGQIDTYQLEKRYFHKNGKLVHAVLFVSLVRDDRGQPSYFVSQIQDLTQQKEVERMKREFIAVVSHELRTPVTAIRGSLGLLLGSMAKSLPDKAAHLVSMAHRNCERLGILINDILDAEKLESGELRVSIAPVELAPFLRHALEVNQSYADKYGVSFEFEGAPERVEVLADANRLMQIMANLLSNAAKFTPRGQAVLVRAWERDDYIRIEVRDPGPGIPEEFRKRIFQKFAQADASNMRRVEGTGLGLNITRQLVEAMGGTIAFDSTLGVGTTFWFELRIAHATLGSGDSGTFMHVNLSSDGSN